MQKYTQSDYHSSRFAADLNGRGGVSWQRVLLSYFSSVGIRGGLVEKIDGLWGWMGAGFRDLDGDEAYSS